MKQLFCYYGYIETEIKTFELNEFPINERQNHPLNQKK
tara:strand:- start:191 stop:304 length:114 start_codon:yes stop_codon:yes gene_type:complete